MTEAVSLIRVSTKNQTAKNQTANTKDDVDIPDQRRIVNQFIEQQGWTLKREFVEGGVSGYKTKTDDRDALQTIKTMAIKGEFDILVVYMSDRIGRIADETPLVISFLNQHNVQIWSVTEGEIKSTTHTDKLITYIRYWQNEGESLKTSVRVSDYHKAAIEEGRFRGGGKIFIPYGYKLVDNGTKNKKGRYILDFVINEEEAKIVQLIYDLSIDKNYGQIRIAQYLNDNLIKNRNGKGWGNSTIQGILNNQIYKGQFHMFSNLYNEEIVSPIQENITIIPEKRWELNRKMVLQRSNQKRDDVVRIDKRPKTTHGKLLLSGFVYCGHCGEKLTTMTAYKTWKTKTGEKKKEQYYKYRCGSFYKRGAIKCDGQSTYGITKIEPKVIKQAKKFILNLQQENITQKLYTNILNKIKGLNQVIEETKIDINKLQKELDVLKNEITKTLLGESKFTPEILQELIIKKEQEIKDRKSFINEKEAILEQLEIEKNKATQFDFDISLWQEKFDNLDLDSKKAMLASIIDKVLIFKDFIDLTFKINIETHTNFTNCRNESMVRTIHEELQSIKKIKFNQKIRMVD